MEIERVGGLDHGYVSYILQGKRNPSIPYAKKLAETLGMFTKDGKPDLTALFEAIEERKAELEDAFHRKLA